MTNKDNQDSFLIDDVYIKEEIKFFLRTNKDYKRVVINQDVVTAVYWGVIEALPDLFQKSIEYAFTQQEFVSTIQSALEELDNKIKNRQEKLGHESDEGFDGKF